MNYQEYVEKLVRSPSPKKCVSCGRELRRNTVVLRVHKIGESGKSYQYKCSEPCDPVGQLEQRVSRLINLTDESTIEKPASLADKWDIRQVEPRREITASGEVREIFPETVLGTNLTIWSQLKKYPRLNYSI